MKVLVIALICINFIIHVLAIIADEQNILIDLKKDLPKDLQLINIIDTRLNSEFNYCYNLGPIKHYLGMRDTQNSLNNIQMPYELITEKQRKILIYRVFIISHNKEDNLIYKSKLNSVGINDIFIKRIDSGEMLLSLGVFTYKKSADEFAKHLLNNGFEVNIKKEEFSYSKRYWFHLKKKLDVKDIDNLKNKSKASDLMQVSAKCMA